MLPAVSSEGNTTQTSDHCIDIFRGLTDLLNEGNLPPEIWFSLRDSRLIAKGPPGSTGTENILYYAANTNTFAFVCIVVEMILRLLVLFVLMTQSVFCVSSFEANEIENIVVNSKNEEMLNMYRISVFAF